MTSGRTHAHGQDLDFDPEALREKYRRERDKRLRPEGTAQYLEVKGQLKSYVDDPYIEKPIERAPSNEAFDVLVIGGGFGGLLAAARLKLAGVEDVRIIDKAGDVGGTWYWNRYPGAACDVDSYTYLPLLEETGFMPTEKYVKAKEIFAYARLIGETFDLYRKAILQTEVKNLTWDDASSRWIVTTDRGDAFRPRYVIMANGPLHRPKLPGIPGIEDFKGHSFHTSRWDYDYTGGTAEGGLDKLKDKRVGVIGTGATSVQCVPFLGQYAKELYVFQRTPSSVDVRANRPTDPEWAASLQPGWHQARMDNFNILVSGEHQEEDLVADGWTDIIRKVGFFTKPRGKAEDGDKGEIIPAEIVQLADFQKMQDIRARVDAVVKDKATAEALKPWYNQFCKRPCFHDEYLTTFNRPNVTLVDTGGAGVARITEHGVVAAGKEYEIDCLVFATGFEIGTAYERRAGYEVHGRGGMTLGEKWKDGCFTLHGLSINGFPNCFLMSLVQSGLTINFPHASNEQAKHIAYIISEAMKRDAEEVEATPEAERAWQAAILRELPDRQKFLEECTPGFYNNEGQPSPLAASFSAYGGGSMAFFKILDEWRKSGDLHGLDIRTAADVTAKGHRRRG